MGICPTLDFHRNFPLTQFLNIRAFSPQRNCLFNPHFLGNWTGNGFFMAGNGAGSSTVASPHPRGSSLCPLDMKLMPVFPVGCHCKHQCSSSLLGQSARKDPTKQSTSGNFPAEQLSCFYLGRSKASPTLEVYSSQQ